jgi:ATP-dependent protease ClpP protease subunit
LRTLKNKKATGENEESENRDIKYFVKSSGDIIDVYLSGQIEASNENSNLFDVLRSAGSNDTIKIYINSSGGDLMTALQFISILKKTEARVFCSVEGECASAATMILMYAKEFEIDDNSIFMFHNYLGEVSGKGGEMLDQMQHEKEWSERFIRETYKDFFSEKEIRSMLDNKDIWLHGEDVSARLQKRISKRRV